jgi:tRNA (Thr-GGU) A37 N-methylase
MSESNTAKDLRDGEIAVELPERFDASLYYIGRIRTPWQRREDCPKNPRETEAVSVARLLRVEGNELSVVGLDCLDNTPLLDIKPYFASTDSVPDASVGWHARISR